MVDQLKKIEIVILSIKIISIQIYVFFTIFGLVDNYTFSGIPINIIYGVWTFGIIWYVHFIILINGGIVYIGTVINKL